MAKAQDDVTLTKDRLVRLLEEQAEWVLDPECVPFEGEGLGNMPREEMAKVLYQAAFVIRLIGNEECLVEIA